MLALLSWLEHLNGEAGWGRVDDGSLIALWNTEDVVAIRDDVLTSEAAGSAAGPWTMLSN